MFSAMAPPKNPARKAYDTPPDLLIGCRGEHPSLFPFHFDAFGMISRGAPSARWVQGRRVC